MLLKRVSIKKTTLSVSSGMVMVSSCFTGVFAGTKIMKDTDGNF
jgi:hypothetical protein